MRFASREARSLHEIVSRASIAPANHPGANQFGVRIQRRPGPVVGQFEHRLFWSMPKYIVKLTTDDHYYKTEGGEQAQIRPRALKKEGPEEQYGV